MMENRNMTRAPALIALSLLAAACARSEDATLEPTDANQALEQVETVRPDNADDEVALGEWRDSLQDEQRALEFGPMGAAPLFSLRCDARRGVVLQRHGLAASGDLPVMLVSVGSETRRLAVTGSGGTNPMLRATLNGSDQLLAALARADTPIAIRIGDTPPLNVPPSPLIGAYVSRCASGGTALPSAAEDGNSAAPAANEAAPAGN